MPIKCEKLYWESKDEVEWWKSICIALNEWKKEKTGSQWDVAISIKLGNDLIIELRRIFKLDNEKYSSWAKRYRKISIRISSGRYSNRETIKLSISSSSLSYDIIREEWLFLLSIYSIVNKVVWHYVFVLHTSTHRIRGHRSAFVSFSL